MSFKKPKHLELPSSDKRPRTDQGLLNPNQETPRWVLGTLDLDGKWSWLKIDSHEIFRAILTKIKNFETMKWTEILGRNNHEVSIESLSPPAQERLKSLRIFDIDKLVSLRITGEERIWGIKTGSSCKLLWWDPDHQVCPSNKKHT